MHVCLSPEFVSDILSSNYAGLVSFGFVVKVFCNVNVLGRVLYGIVIITKSLLEYEC